MRFIVFIYAARYYDQFVVGTYNLHVVVFIVRVLFDFVVLDSAISAFKQNNGGS